MNKEQSLAMEIDIPDFGEGIGHLASHSTPSQLYRCLLNPSDNVHFFEPAFKLVVSILEGASLPQIAAEDRADSVQALVDWASERLSRPPEIGPHATSWTARVAREFAPAGLTDGAWLHGIIRANVVENEVGMDAIKQLMIRFGDPGANESYVQRYASLLRSVGVVPESISRWERQDSSPCAEISYEHALLGLALGLFPSALRPETVGYNLWVATLGPCPLLERLADELREGHANLQYLELHDRGAMAQLATQTAVHYLEENDSETARARIARGFVAAHESYVSWEQAMLGRNVPMSPRQFVLEIIRRKAHFALGHHTRLSFGETKVVDLFKGGEAGHEAMLGHLVSSGLVKPGKPDRSPLMKHSISFEGPMFDVFPPSEQRDLREWILGLEAETANPRKEAPIALRGEYGRPQDPKDLHAYTMKRYGPLPVHEQMYLGSNSDQNPAVRLFAKTVLSSFLQKLQDAFENDPRLAVTPPPRWSERTIAELVEARHDSNIQSRPENQGAEPGRAPTPMNAPTPEKPSIAIAFDGIWLQGFADVHRSDREEYGWLFRIYASEQGDGSMAWNHNRIMRKAVSDIGIEAMLPATDLRLYEHCDVNPSNLMLLAASLDTRYFMPELLGCNLGIESSGVGGSYLDGWRGFVREDRNPWAALSYRLHNSIDNYVTGHTKWSLAAVQSFMARVEENVPESVEAQWQRIWRVWRLQEILEHGSPDEREAIRETIGFDPASLAPITAAMPSAEDAHEAPGT